MLTRERFKTQLAAYRPDDLPDELTPQRAAVAALLRFEAAGPEVLLMRRGDRPGDRWSGHISLPGGRREPSDADLLATAIRETREEVGRHLDQTARLAGRLGDVQARARGGALPMAIRPFVFIEREHEPLALGPEAVSALWLPLERVVAGALDSTFDYPLDAVPMRFPCWKFEGQVIWGLTYYILSELLTVVAGAVGFSAQPTETP